MPVIPSHPDLAAASDSAEQARESDGRLIRGIGPWALVAFAVNLTVGAGILGLPGRIQSLVGTYSVVVIVLCGVLIALIGLCFAEIASRFDRSGGPQLYASIALGPTSGFTVGWLLWISRVGSCAAVANLLVDYGAVLSPALSTPLSRAALVVMLALFYMGINIAGIRQTAAVSTTFTIVKITPLVVFVGVGLFFVEPGALRLGPMPPVQDMSAALLLAAFAFLGFDATTVLSGETRNPARSVPFAIVVAVSGVLVLYALIQVVCVGTLPSLATSQRPLADAASLFVGPWGAIAIAVTAVIACAGVYGASFTPGTRLLLAMAEHKQLPAMLARVHRGYHTPIHAIVATTVVVLALALSGSFIYLVKITLISRIAVYATTCALLPVFRRRRDVPDAPFKVPAGNIVAYFAAGCCVLALASSSMRELLDVAGAVLCGLGLFGLTLYARRAAAVGTAR